MDNDCFYKPHKQRSPSALRAGRHQQDGVAGSPDRVDGDGAVRVQEGVSEREQTKSDKVKGF